MSQVCNHPMLSYPCYADFDPTLLVRECGKMEVLDRLLVKLHATGHRVLLFSTMTKARDWIRPLVLEDVGNRGVSRA